MKVIEQLCVKGFEITAENGGHWEAIQGRTYTTTEPKPDEEMVTVFSTFWVPVPKTHFVIKENSVFNGLQEKINNAR